MASAKNKDPSDSSQKKFVCTYIPAPRGENGVASVSLTRAELERALYSSYCDRDDSDDGPSSYLGKTVVRKFNGIEYSGVIRCKRQGDKGETWFTVCCAVFEKPTEEIFYSVSLLQVVYGADSDVEELELSEVKECLCDDVVLNPNARGSSPRVFSRDSWLVRYEVHEPKRNRFCIVHRTLGDLHEDTFGCSECSVVVTESDEVLPCYHVMHVQSLLTASWNGTALMAPLPDEPEHLRSLHAFRRVYDVYVITGKTEGSHGDTNRDIQPGFYSNSLPFDACRQFRVSLAVLSDFHGTNQIVTGERDTHALFGELRPIPMVLDA